jgi:hypothetical protein
MSSTITVLYTQNIRGQIGLLPRHATLIKRLRGQTEGQLLLLDAGGSCSNDVRLCHITEGRASLILLDAIGYDAANVTGFLSERGRQKLGTNYLNMALVDADHSFVRNGIAFAAQPPASREHHLYISLKTAAEVVLLPESTHGYVYTLTLRTLAADEVGLVTVSLNDTVTELVCSSVHALTPDVRPDPTITSTLEFIKQEAHLYEKQQKGENG